MTPSEIEAVLRAECEKVFEAWQRVRAQELGLPRYEQPELIGTMASALAAVVVGMCKTAALAEAAKHADCCVEQEELRMAQISLRDREQAAEKWEKRVVAYSQEIARLNDDIAMRRGLAEGAQQLGVLVAQQFAKHREELARLKRAVGHAAHRNHVSTGCDGCLEVDAALAGPEQP